MAKKNRNISGKEHYDMLIAKKQYEQMLKPWYRKLEYWKAISWSVFTLLTTFVMYQNGVFDFRVKEVDIAVKAMEAKRDNLEFDIKKHASFQESLITKQEKLIAENKILEMNGIQMAMANRKAYFNLDERGKRLFELSQQLAEVHRKNQRLEDEKEFSSKNTYTSNGILPLANNTSLSNSVYTLVQPTQSFGIITGTLIPTNTNTNTSATGLTANISDYSKYFTDANRTITSTLSTWGINQPNNYSAIDLSKVDFSNLNGTYSGEKPKWYQTENTLGLGNTTKLDTNLFKNILQYSQIKN